MTNIIRYPFPAARSLRGADAAEPWAGKERRVCKRPTTGAWPERRKPQPDADGWIAWNGGECPVPDGVRFQIRMRDGAIVAGYPGPHWDWRERSFKR